MLAPGAASIALVALLRLFHAQPVAHGIQDKICVSLPTRFLSRQVVELDLRLGGLIHIFIGQAANRAQFNFTLGHRRRYRMQRQLKDSRQLRRVLLMSAALVNVVLLLSLRRVVA